MQFGDYFGINRGPTDDWFDPDLSHDTPLFVDPFLVWLEEDDSTSKWRDAHQQMLDHFKESYDLVSTGGTPASSSVRRAEALLRFPEPAEFCLDYTAKGTRGLGGGMGRARQMMDGIAVAISMGLDTPEHIEEVGFLTERIGADSISDATCNILKNRFIDYTQTVAARHRIPTKLVQVSNAAVDLRGGRWIRRRYDFPVGPDGRPILLVPSRFISELPILNADDLFDSTLNLDLRNAMNVRVARNLSKAELVRQARKRPDRIRRWADHVKRNGLGSSYRMADDPLGIVRWQSAG